MLIYPNKFVKASEIGHVDAGSKVSVPGPGYGGFDAFEAVKPAGKGYLLAILFPDSFDIERVAAAAPIISQGFEAVNDPDSYLVRFVRQIDKSLNPAGSRNR